MIVTIHFLKVSALQDQTWKLEPNKRTTEISAGANRPQHTVLQYDVRLQLGHTKSHHCLSHSYTALQWYYDKTVKCSVIILNGNCIFR